VRAQILACAVQTACAMCGGCEWGVGGWRGGWAVVQNVGECLMATSGFSMCLLSGVRTCYGAYHLLSTLLPSAIDRPMLVSFGLRNESSMSLR
jgi:hypothetical protein